MVLTVVVSMPLTFGFFAGGSFSSALSALNRALLLFGTPALFIPIVSRGERVNIIDIASSHSEVRPMLKMSGKAILVWDDIIRLILPHELGWLSSAFIFFKTRVMTPKGAFRDEKACCLESSNVDDSEMQ